MGTITTYRRDQSGKFCQIKYSDGSRILISMAQTGVRIYRLKWMGLANDGIVFDISTEDLFSDKCKLARERLTEKSVEPDFLDVFKDVLLPCNSIQEAQDTLSTIFKSWKPSTEKTEIICREFGQYLANKLPIIKDIELLPYPKEIIMEALSISIQHLQNQIEPEDARQLLNALESSRTGLMLFAEIDTQDREAVAYFNQYPNINAVPDQRKKECLRLITKYMEKGMVRIP